MNCGLVVTLTASLPQRPTDPRQKYSKHKAQTRRKLILRLLPILTLLCTHKCLAICDVYCTSHSSIYETRLAEIRSINTTKKDTLHTGLHMVSTWVLYILYKEHNYKI
jgi:hypothetical protein